MEGLLSLLLFAGFFFLMMRFGCGAHMAHGGHGHHGAGDAPDHTDPVCGMKVPTTAGYGKMHDGSLYRFCSRSCLDKFEADPDHYLNPKEEGA
jgi:YHS domain-containing protein